MDVSRPFLLRPREAAIALGLGRTSVYAMIAAGELPAIRLKGQLRIPSAALQRWVEAQPPAHPERAR